MTRIEGHSKITIHLDEEGRVEEARFHVTQFRGFEKFCEGRPFYEMPSLMARICGICPVSHLIASAKACDALLAVRIPPTAASCAASSNLAQIVQSHALSFFHLSSPDLLLGMDADPATRNIFGVAENNPELARDGIRLRQFGQQIIEWLGGKRIHPAWVVPGGVSEPLTEENRDEILAALPGALAIAERTLDWFKKHHGALPRRDPHLRQLPHAVHGPGQEGRRPGALRRQAPLPRRRRPHRRRRSRPHQYADYHRRNRRALELPEDPPTTSRSGYPDGIYRVGPLARLNIVDRCGTPRADQEWAEFRELERGAVLSSFHYHYARLIEILYGIERMEQLLNDPDILDPSTCAPYARAQCARRRRRRRSPARHADPSLQDRRARPDQLGQPDHRHRPQQPGHEPRRAAGGPAFRARQPPDSEACSTASRP